MLAHARSLAQWISDDGLRLPRFSGCVASAVSFMGVNIDDPDLFDDGLVKLDFTNGAVTFERRTVDLNPIEYKLLVALVRHQDQVLSSRQLCDLAEIDTWVSRGGNPQIKHEMHELRAKLQKSWGRHENDSPIQLVRGHGWRYRSLII